MYELDILLYWPLSTNRQTGKQAGTQTDRKKVTTERQTGRLKAERKIKHATRGISTNWFLCPSTRLLVGSLKKNTALEYSTRVVQEGDRRCKKSTLNDLAYLTPLRIPLMSPVFLCYRL